MACLFCLCILLLLTLFALLLKIAALHRAASEIRQEFLSWFDSDTNTGITLSSRDRHMRRLAADLNRELRRLRAARLRFEQGDRELKESITNLSHDLRTPLTAILGYLDLLDYVEKPEQVKRYLSMIRNRSEVLKQQTEELFGYSIVKSVPEEEASPLSLNRALEESLASYYGAMTGAGITPEVFIPARTVTRCLNRFSLTRIFGNIIGNALKYSDGDLSVTMAEDGTIVFSNRAARLSPVTAGRLFDRYYTVESGQRGSGLGLSISKLLTEQMGGKISADYREGRLSITLSFPDGNGVR